jgi:hypothetical protein
MIFKRPCISFRKQHLSMLLGVVSLPTIIVTEEKLPFPSLVFTPSSKWTWFFKRAFNLSWHSIACNQFKSKKWPMEKGQISHIMKEVISINMYIFEFVSFLFVSKALILKHFLVCFLLLCVQPFEFFFVSSLTWRESWSPCQHS